MMPRLVLVCLIAFPALPAAAERELPRLLILKGANELPGDYDGDRFGVTIRRGDGFPEPVAEEEEEPPREPAADPDDIQVPFVVPRSRRYGY